MAFLNWDISCMILHKLIRYNDSYFIIRISIGELFNVIWFLIICATKRDSYKNGVNYYIFILILAYILVFHFICSITGRMSPYTSKRCFLMYKLADCLYDILLLVYSHYLVGLTKSIAALTITTILCTDIFFNCVSFCVLCVVINLHKRSQDISQWHLDCQ